MREKRLGGKSSKGRSFWRGFAAELKEKERTKDKNSAR